MRKAKITSHEDMSRSQIRQDMSLSPMERVEIALQLSDLALKITKTRTSQEEFTSIRWIELHKTASRE
jgi:hypothetical protein